MVIFTQSAMVRIANLSKMSMLAGIVF